MPLPSISTPTYELELPSTGKNIKYRPFLVKEEKILILALESQDTKQITNAIKQVLKECILTKGIKVEDLPTFDIEYIFLNVRGKSVGESIDLIVTCYDDGETQVPITVYIDEVKVQKNPEHNKDIKLDDKLVLRMKYPSLDQFIKNNFDFSTVQSESNIEKSFDIIASCIEAIFTDDESWAASDCTKKELIEFIESMNSSQFKKIEQFFETMPKLSHKIKVINPKTKVENEVVLEGLTSFFGRLLAHMELESYFKINFALMQFHKYSLTEIENMMPWERDIYLALLRQHIEDEKLKQQQANASN